MRALLLITVYLAGLSQLFAASIQVYPADLRMDKSVQFIGEVSNSIFFRISANEDLSQKIPAFQAGQMDYQLKISLPADLQLIGIENVYNSGASFITDKVKITEEMVKDRKYNVYQATLDSKSIMDRLVKNAYLIDVYVWVKPEAVFSGIMKWELVQGDKVIAAGNNPLKTVGTVKDKAFSPDFIVHLNQGGTDLTYLPPAEMKERAQLIKKTGFTHVNQFYYNIPLKEVAESVAELQKLGIVVLAERSGSFSNFRNEYMDIDNQKKNGGLIRCAPLMVAEMSSPKEVEFLKNGAPWAQGFAYDLETEGVRQSPGLDDDAAISAFGANIGVQNMTKEMITTPKYSAEYAAYRSKLCAAPVFGCRKLVDLVNPKWPIFLCHGNGFPLSELDYRDYDDTVQYHLPMIYVAGQSTFFSKCEDFNRYVNPQKSIPTSSFGWSGGPLTRSAAEDIGMDMVSAAMAGCKGYSIWPGMYQMDGGLLYGFYLGSSWIKEAVNFFQHGAKADNIKNEPLPYIEKKMRVGAKTIDLSQPQWSSQAVIRTFKLSDEYLLAIANYNRNDTIFVKFIARDLPDKKYYCVNLATDEYLTNNGQKTFSANELEKGVVLKAKAFNPGFWLLTSDAGRITGRTEISAKQINDEFTQAKSDFIANNCSSDIQLGRKGSFEIAYENVKIDNKENALLMVNDPVQKVGFTTSGGRIMQWSVNSCPNLILQNITQGGFGMDLFWWPVNGRWNGDQLDEMKLVSVINTGKQVEIRFSGKADRTITAFRLEKTYTLVADKPGFTLAIKLINENSAPTSTLAYWSHNVMDFGQDATGKFFYLDAGNKITPVPDVAGSANYFIPNKDILPDNRKYLNPTSLLADGLRVLGVYSAKAKMGVVVVAPKDFLSLYAWSSHGACGLEWMLQPQTINYSGSTVIRSSFVPYLGEMNGFEAKLIELGNQNK